MPEVNAREAAVVSGVNVYPVKSLIDVVNLLNSGNGISPLQVDTSQMLGETDQNGAPTLKKCADSSRPSGRWKLPAPADTTF